ncbi:hypothetical protein BHE74_00036647 [Ensete ventricosum]|nr:hypothetical protein BHE74_00036647 [Ensete ventricosum]
MTNPSGPVLYDVVLCFPSRSPRATLEQQANDANDRRLSHTDPVSSRHTTSALNRRASSTVTTNMLCAINVLKAEEDCVGMSLVMVTGTKRSTAQSP